MFHSLGRSASLNESQSAATSAAARLNSTGSLKVPARDLAPLQVNEVNTLDAAPTPQPSG